MEDDQRHDQTQQNTRDGQLAVEPSGTHLTLAQSLKAIAQAQQGDHEGWAVATGRAEAFVRAAGMSVTRLLFQPDLRLCDPAVEEDLQVLACAVADDCGVKVTTMGRDSRKVRTHQLDDLHVAGPVNDAIRETAVVLMQALIEDTIGKAVEAGGLPGLASFDKLHKLSTVAGMTPEALVDKHWDAAAEADQANGGPGETAGKVLFSREQLADAMLEAALQALGALPPELLPGGGVVGEQLADPPTSETTSSRQGWVHGICTDCDQPSYRCQCVAQ